MRHLSHLLSNCTLPPGHMVQREGQIQATMKQKVTTHSARYLIVLQSPIHKSAYTLPTVWPNFAQRTGLPEYEWLPPLYYRYACVVYVHAPPSCSLTAANCELIILQLQTKDPIQSPHSVALNGLRDLNISYTVSTVHGNNVQARLALLCCTFTTTTVFMVIWYALSQGLCSAYQRTMTHSPSHSGLHNYYITRMERMSVKDGEDEREGWRG